MLQPKIMLHHYLFPLSVILRASYLCFIKRWTPGTITNVKKTQQQINTEGRKIKQFA